MDEIAFIETLPPLMGKRITSHDDDNFRGCLRKFDGARRALPSGAPRKSLISQVRDIDTFDGNDTITKTRIVPPVTAQQKADLVRLMDGGWSDSPSIQSATKNADEREAALLSSLSKKCGRRVIRNDAGIFGYYNETQTFIELE